MRGGTQQQQEKTRVALNDLLIKYAYLVLVDGTSYIFTDEGFRIAKLVDTQMAQEEVSADRMNFDIIIIEQNWNFLRTDIETDGNCLFRSFVHCLQVGQEKHSILRKLSCDFIQANKSLFASKFQQLRDQEQGAQYNHYHPIKDFDHWLNLNKQDTYYDDYGELHFISLQYLFTVIIQIFDKYGNIMYPTAYSSEHHDFAQQLLSSNEQHDFQIVNMVKYRAHYESLLNTLSPIQLKKCIVKNFAFNINQLLMIYVCVLM